MSQLSQDIRIALRGFRRTPAFAITVIAILGLGIGTAVAMFTVFRAVLLEQLPVRDAGSLVVAYTYKDPAVEFGLQLEDLKTIAADARTISGLAAYAHWGANAQPLVDGDRPLTINRSAVTGNFFDVLGARPAIGRLLRPDDALKGAAPVLVISYKIWQRDFAGDSNIVGRTLVEPYSQARFTIVGVAPAGLDVPTGAEFWMPAGPEWTGLAVFAVARLAPGATPAAFSSELLSIKQRISPDLHLIGVKSTGFTEAVLGNVRPALIILMSAVLLLLVIACVNVGNLLLLRAGLRARELAIRRALGAAYGDIVRQLLAESALLALGGGAFGLVCAQALLRALLLVAPAQLPRVDVIQLSGTPIIAAVAATLVAALLFGVVPALLAARGEVASTLRLDSRAGRDSTSRSRVRRLLVASQTALALVMLAGAALLGRSLSRLEGIKLGYNADRLSILSVSWAATELHADSGLYPTGEALTRRLSAIPGVTAITPIVCAPLHGPNVCAARLDIEGQSTSEREANPIIPIETGGEEFFKVFGIPIKKGRGFVDADRENAPQVALVSEAVARRFWPNQDPVGKRIHYWASPDTTSWRTVIGVVGDVRLRSLRDATPGVFVPWRQINFWQGTFAVRTSGPLSSVLPAMRREVRAVDPTLNLWFAHPMDELLAAPLAQPRMSALIMSGFGIAALILATLGLYGLMASMVGERTREIGVRMALGATPERVRREILAQALITCGSGALAGIAGALAASRLLASQLFEVSATDPLSIVAASALLLAVALAAAYVPARRATRIDPTEALRAD
jgi:putative ABC transport system permease protein